MKLAILSNNAKLFESVSSRAAADGFVCTRFADEIRLARAALRHEFSAILIDAGAGLDTVRPALRRHKRSTEHRTPVLVIALRADSNDIEIAFELGADDVVTAPLDYRELFARVRCAARRVAPVAASQDLGRIELGPYRLENAECAAYIDGKPIALANREFALAWMLFSRPGDFVTRREIAAAVWLSSEDVVGRSLEQHVYKLRKKLCLNGEYGIALRTRYALGYRIDLNAKPEELEADASDARGRADAERPRAFPAPAYHEEAEPRPQAAPQRRAEEHRAEARPTEVNLDVIVGMHHEDTLSRRRRDDFRIGAFANALSNVHREDSPFHRRRDDRPQQAAVERSEQEKRARLFGEALRTAP